MNRWPFAVLASAACCIAMAAPAPAPVRTEIDALLARLLASGCTFKRNGSWYAAREARAHLLLKLDNMAARTTITSTEQFIEQAGSASSSSGEPYQVKCGASAPVTSRDWLTRELAAIRSTVRGRARP